MSKPDTTKTFVDKYEDEIKKYFINKEIGSGFYGLVRFCNR
jgi:hypothetical protein